MLAVAAAEGVAFISAGATIIAAVILGGLAAWTADRRQTKQLKEESERQRRELYTAAERQSDELRAERERLDATLAHERELADLADLRKLLDESVVALNDARDARDQLEISFGEHGLHVPPEPLYKLRDCGNTIDRLLVRIHIRLGAEDEITDSFQGAAEALLATWRAAKSEDDDALVMKEKRGAIRVAHGDFVKSYNAFMRAATARAGTLPLESKDIET
jgi:hypothetical protein